MQRSNKFSTFDMCAAGLLLAMFFLSGNVIPAIQLIPKVPITLQTMVIALTGVLLGSRRGGLTVLALYFITLAGVPVFSAFGAGPAVFGRPSVGYTLGFLPMALITGLYPSVWSRLKKGTPREVWSRIILALLCFAAIAADYTCGAAGYIAATGGTAGFWVSLANAFTFLPADAVKMAVVVALAPQLLHIKAGITAPVRVRSK